MAAFPAPSGIHDPRAPALPGQRTLRDFAAAFFTFTLVADAAYARTVILMWQDFASWMLFAGLVAGGLSVLLWLGSLAMHRHRPHWPVVILNLLVLVAALVNSLVHAGDGWTAIVPWGIGLSVVTCLLMLASAVLSRLAFRHDHP
ncbi:MAG: membrane protein [Rhodobacter sp. CACIA14H1]|nr:MAG: membrane protein [Rhodobacter sp. CACIA14H1]